MKTDSISFTLQKHLTSIYLSYLMLAFFLGYHDHYFDIAQAKRTIFVYGTVLYLLLMFFLFLPSIRSTFHINRIDSLHLCFFILIASSFLGLINNINLYNAFWGTGEKCTGLLIYLLGWFSLFCISKTFSWDGILSWIFLFTCAFVYILQILNRFLIDPLAMYDNLKTEQIPAFLSTLGHMNYNASFNCIMLATNLIFLLNCKNVLSKILYNCCLFLGFCGSICCNSYSVYLGIGGTFLLVFLYCQTHPQKWITLWFSMFLFVCSSAFIAFIYFVTPKTIILVGGATIFTSAMIIIFEFILLIVSYLILVYHHSWFNVEHPVLQRASIVSIIAIASIGIIALFYLALDSTFASGRGLIWQKCFRLFTHASPFHILFGYGYNNLHFLLERFQGNALDLSDSAVIMDAHNIFLNTLITSGIVGTLSWGAFLLTLLKKGLQLCADHEDSLFIVVGIIVYLIQGLVNGPQIITTPIFLIELGIYWGIINNMALSSSTS